MTEPTTYNVAVIGCGYVGYPLALVLAGAGHRVTAVDTDPAVVERILTQAMLPTEPGIAELARTVSETDRLIPSGTVVPADVYIIAVPTPLDPTGKRADLSAVKSAAQAIVPILKHGDLVVVESTVPPGTCNHVVAPILAANGLNVGEDVFLAHCPERVFPGNSVDELTNVARVVGGINLSSSAAAIRFYETFVTAPLSATSATTAEISKVMENTYRDVNIALANQVAAIARSHGIDPSEPIRIANQHPRVAYADPGIGVGGHCIPIDPWFLLDDIEDGGVIAAARAINDNQPHRLASLISEQVADIESPRIVIVGIAYKPDVVDTRGSPALAICNLLESAGMNVVVYDPVVDHPTESLTVVATGTDLIVILVRHRQVADLLADERGAIGSAMRHNRVIDLSTGTTQDR